MGVWHLLTVVLL